MAVRLAINGFGRIGRTVLRVFAERAPEGMQVVAINDLAPLETAAHLFEFDSLHGRFGKPVTPGEGTLDIGCGPLRFTSERTPETLPWGDVDIVLECTGAFRSADQAARHLQNGSKRVLISAPAKGDLKTIIFGVNDHTITAQDRLLSNASCTTNCLVPVAHVLDKAFGILRGHMTTVHCYTNTQPVHDAAHTDLYRARAAGLSMIPTTTGAAETMGQVLPHLNGKITGTAVRVPTPNVSCIDLVVETRDTATKNAVNDAMHDAANASLNGIVGVTDRKLVSTDFSHDPRSAIFATDQTAIQQGNLIRVLAWYDNEWAFCHRMLDTASAMAHQIRHLSSFISPDKLRGVVRRTAGQRPCDAGSARKPSRQRLRHPGRHKFADIATQPGDLLDEFAGNRLMLRLGHQEHRLNRIVQLTVHSNHLIFILKICHGPQTTHNHLRPHITRAVDQQVFKGVCHNLDPGLPGQRRTFRFDHRHPLFQIKQRSLVPVDRHADHEFVHQFGRPPDDVDMSQCDRVKGTGIKANTHEIVLFSDDFCRKQPRNNTSRKTVYPPWPD
jgi:glyceraldehyde 3-phosphate dehydrogenase